MTNLLRIELDCYSDEARDSNDEFNLDVMTRITKECAGKHNVTATLVDESGPGGGCPVYAFVGTRSDIKAYMREYHNAGLTGTNLEKELEAMLEFAEPA